MKADFWRVKAASAPPQFPSHVLWGMRRTSIEAYTKLKVTGMLETRRGEAYRVLYFKGPLTGAELEKASGVRGMWKRLSELKALRLAEEVETRPCKITGQNAIAWDVTDHILEDVDFERMKPKILFVIKRDGNIGTAYKNEDQARKEWKPKLGSLLQVKVQKELIP